MGWRLLDVILAGPLAVPALFALGVLVAKSLWWAGVRLALSRLWRDWRLWLLVATVYEAFTASWIVGRYGLAVGVVLSLVLLAFCFWSIRLGVEECEQALRESGFYPER